MDDFQYEIAKQILSDATITLTDEQLEEYAFLAMTINSAELNTLLLDRLIANLHDISITHRANSG